MRPKSFAERYAEARRVREKYPDFIPIIIETTLPLDKRKYLVHADLALRDLMATVRQRLKISPSTGLFFLIGNNLALIGGGLRELYTRYQHPDGFLYLKLAAENTFGGVSK